jgi:hypothetical protein
MQVDDEHGIHCDGCRQLGYLTDRSTAIAAAKAALAELPEHRRAELNARFDLAGLQAREHAAYVRRG